LDPVVCIKIRMRVHFHLPLHELQVQGENPRNISVSGDAATSHVRHAHAGRRVSINATEWKILNINEIDTEQENPRERVCVVYWCSIQ
jgi:hypothetical protein